MWPFDIIFDFSWLYNLVLGCFMILAGIIALGMVPGKLLKLLIGGGLMIGGAAIVFGYWAVF